MGEKRASPNELKLSDGGPEGKPKSRARHPAVRWSAWLGDPVYGVSGSSVMVDDAIASLEDTVAELAVDSL